LLGDLGYTGEEMFSMRRLSDRKIPENTNYGLVKEFNKMHAGYRVRVEWGISGLKQKWRRFTKRYDSTRIKYDNFFMGACVMTNFLHRRRMDWSEEVIGEQQDDEDDHGWDGDY
jgi:hypothetical protein